MGLLDGIFGGGRGGADDPYADILTPAQRNQQLTQGLLAMAGAFAQAGMPSRIGPVPIGSAIGSAAAALGAGQESGMKTALENALAAQKVRDLRSTSEFRKKFFGDQDSIADALRQIYGGGTAAPAAPAGARPSSGGGTPPAGTYAPPEAPAAPLEMDLPYPNAPGAAGLLGGGAAPEDADLVGTGLLGAAPPPRNASLTGAAWERANNNLGGMRRPGVVATPSQGGFQTFDTPEAGLAAISRQLDRYASGATTGTPLTTIRQVVSTWAPPNENPTEALIKRASQVVGVSPDQPLDFNNPAVKAKLIEATIRNEQGGKLPVDPALITKVAGSGGGGLLTGDQWVNQNAPFPTRANPQGQPIRYAAAAPAIDPNEPASLGPGSPYGRSPGDPAATGPILAPDTVIPSARSEMGGARMTQAQYSPNTSDQGWGPNWSQAAPAAPPGGAGAGPGMPQVPVPPGVDPAKMNALLLELARRNAAAEVLGMGNPYGSLLGVLQGSPQYKAAVEAATEQARRAAGLPFVRPEAEEKAAGTYPYEAGLKKYQSALDRANKEAEQLGAARYDLTKIPVSDGKGGVAEIQGTREQAVRVANGLPVPELGISGIVNPPGGGPATGSPVRQPVSGPLDAADIKVFEQKRATADTARTTIENANDLRAAIEQGVIAGSGANARTELLKLGQLLKLTGPSEDALIRNTEAYIASQGRGLKDGLSGLGPPISKSDTDIAERIAGGQMNTTQGMLEILRIREKYNRQAIVDYNRMASGLPPSKIIGDRAIKEPPTYGAQIIEGPNGHRLWNNKGKWQEF